MALVLGLAGDLRAVNGLVPCDLQQPQTKTGCTTLTPLALSAELVGPGILSIANVTYTGATISAGMISGGAGIIGFDSGILLSTGNIATVVGPNNSGSASTNLGLLLVPPNSTGRPGDADLTALSGFPTHDATVLEFDFVPDKDRVFLQYVFASEEYNEFVNRKIGGKLFCLVATIFHGAIASGNVAMPCRNVAGVSSRRI